MRSILFAAILAIVGFVPPLTAQSKTGTVVGSVQDQQKAFVTGAQVTIKNIETNETYKTLCDEAGDTVQLPGFPRATMPKVKVKEGKSTKLAPTTLSAPAFRFYPLELPQVVPIPLSPAAPPSSNQL